MTAPREDCTPLTEAQERALRARAARFMERRLRRRYPGLRWTILEGEPLQRDRDADAAQGDRRLAERDEDDPLV
jgi:hypothetical protein